MRAGATEVASGLQIGVEDGDVWQLWMYTQKINWGKLRGLQRCHYHLSRVLSLLLKGENKQGQAYLVQLDGGHWRTASLILPVRDPIFTEEFGATERELEAVSSYQEAIGRLKYGRRSQWYDQDGWYKDADKPDPKGKGKDKGKKKPWWAKKKEEG